MEEAGWLSSSWGPSENGRKARFYTLTPAGRQQLKAETEEWGRVSLTMTLALKAQA